MSFVAWLTGAPAWAQVKEHAVDIPTRAGVTLRFLLAVPDNPKAAVILFSGGHGGLQIKDNGSLAWGNNNFLVRNRRNFAAHGLMVATVDAPSDRQRPPYLTGFRQTPEHVADIKALIGWLKQQANIPVWLVGTSRGTQSAGFAATQLPKEDGGPDGLVLTATVLLDPKGRPVPAMDLEKIAIPVLVAHHRHDGCWACLYSDLPRLMKKLTRAKKTELLTFEGGMNRGDPCEALAYHGFNGLDADVVGRIATWILEAGPRS